AVKKQYQSNFTKHVQLLQIFRCTCLMARSMRICETASASTPPLAPLYSPKMQLSEKPLCVASISCETTLLCTWIDLSSVSLMLAINHTQI
ncbi:hypothetical protein L9F63_002619, partial [Diploptera punctata]